MGKGKAGEFLTGPSVRGLLCMAVFIVLVSAFEADAAGPGQDVAVEQAKTQAAPLLEAGRVEEAHRLYLNLVREVPEDDEVNLGLARSADRLGEYNQAAIFMERLVDKYPRNQSLRLELVKIHIRAGNPEAAKREMELARRYDPSVSEETGDLVVARLTEQLARWQFSGRVSTGLQYDSNVNQGPQSLNMSLGPWNLQLDPSIREKASWGVYFSASLNGGWRIAPEGAWWIVGDAALYRKGSFRDMPTNREVAWGRGALGLRRIGATTLFDLRVKTDAVDYIGDDRVARSNGPELQFVWAALPGLHFLTRAALERRDYQETNGRQGWYWWAGEYLRILFGKEGHAFLFGGRYLHAETSRNDYGYEGWEGTASVTLKLPFDTELTPFMAYREEYYNGPATALELRDREDENLRLGAMFSWQVSPSFSVDMSYQFSRNDSTSPVYEYDQHLVSSGVTWKF